MLYVIIMYIVLIQKAKKGICENGLLLSLRIVGIIEAVAKVIVGIIKIVNEQNTSGESYILTAMMCIVIVAIAKKRAMTFISHKDKKNDVTYFS